MSILEIIKERKVSTLLEIKSETVKPITEKWLDGQVRTTDNLQIEFRAAGKGTTGNVTGYLHYYDQSGNYLGHDFDLTNEKFKHGEFGYLSFILELPQNVSYAVIEIEAERISDRIEFYVYLVGVMALGLFYPMAKSAFSPLVFFGGVITYLLLLTLAGRYVASILSKLRRARSE